MSMNHIEFFGKSSLVGYSYYYFLQSLPAEARTNLSKKIQSKGGIVTFSITNSNIIVINSLNDIKFLQFPFEEKHRNINVYYNNHSEIIINQFATIEEPIKCIVLQDLIEAIETMSIVNTIDLHYENGLPRGVDIACLISLVMIKGNSKRLTYYQFNKVEKRKNSRIMIYEIPEYFRDAPDGFSIFCSITEKNEIDKHMRNKSKKKSAQMIKDDEKLTFALPEPRKENFYCQLCKKKYSNYYEHLNSESHKNQKKENSFLYERIQASFQRIRNYKTEGDIKPSKISKKKDIKKHKEHCCLNTNNNLLLTSNANINPLFTTITTSNIANDPLSNNNSNSTMIPTLMVQEQKNVDHHSIDKLMNSKVLDDINENLLKWNKKRKFNDLLALDINESPSKTKSRTRRYEPLLMQKISKCLLKIKQKQIKINQ